MSAPKCHHIATDVGCCNRAAQWGMAIGNGDRAMYSCGVHLNKMAEKMHTERAATIAGHSFTIWKVTS